MSTSGSFNPFPWISDTFTNEVMLNLVAENTEGITLNRETQTISIETPLSYSIQDIQTTLSTYELKKSLYLDPYGADNTLEQPKALQDTIIWLDSQIQMLNNIINP